MSHVTLYLPKQAKLSLAPNTKVSFGSDLASVQSVQGVVFNIADFLKIPKKEIGKALKKKIGQKIARHEILAEVSSNFGFSKKHFVMPFNGVLQNVDGTTGLITVYPELVQTVSIKSPVDGFIKEVAEDKVVIEFNGNLHYGKQGIGGLGKGKLAVISHENEEVNHNIISDNLKGTILLGGYFPNQVLAKASSLGVVSILATKVDPADFVYFDNSAILRLILMEISSVDYKALLAQHGKDVVVEGLHKRIYTN